MSVQKCAHCGYKTTHDWQTCPLCGYSVDDVPTAGALGWTTVELVIAAQSCLMGAMLFLFAAAFVRVAFLARTSGPLPVVVALVMVAGMGFLALLGSAYIACGAGLLMLKPWARTVQMVLAALQLPAFPVGTGVGILMLMYFTRPGIEILYSGRPLGEIDEGERHLVREVQKSWLAIVITIISLPWLLVTALMLVFMIKISGSIF